MEKTFHCMIVKADFVGVGSDDDPEGLNIYVREDGNEACVQLSWNDAAELRDHLTSLIATNKKRF